MTTLRAMPPQAYPDYVEASIAAYADENVAAGRWPPQGALERSREDYDALLPHGLETPDNFLFEIVAEEGGAAVGVVWVALDRRHGTCAAYLYDLEVQPAHRRAGHAWRGLQAVERFAVDAGATTIGLNVFANNTAAQALYRKLGYATTNFNMRKPLGGSDD